MPLGCTSNLAIRLQTVSPRFDRTIPICTALKAVKEFLFSRSSTNVSCFLLSFSTTLGLDLNPSTDEDGISSDLKAFHAPIKFTLMDECAAHAGIKSSLKDEPNEQTGIKSSLKDESDEQTGIRFILKNESAAQAGIKFISMDESAAHAGIKFILMDESAAHAGIKFILKGIKGYKFMRKCSLRYAEANVKSLKMVRTHAARTLIGCNKLPKASCKIPKVALGPTEMNPGANKSKGPLLRGFLPANQLVERTLSSSVICF